MEVRRSRGCLVASVVQKKGGFANVARGAFPLYLAVTAGHFHSTWPTPHGMFTLLGLHHKHAATCCPMSPIARRRC